MADVAKSSYRLAVEAHDAIASELRDAEKLRAIAAKAGEDLSSHHSTIQAIETRLAHHWNAMVREAENVTAKGSTSADYLHATGTKAQEAMRAIGRALTGGSTAKEMLSNVGSKTIKAGAYSFNKGFGFMGKNPILGLAGLITLGYAAKKSHETSVHNREARSLAQQNAEMRASLQFDNPNAQRSDNMTWAQAVASQQQGMGRRI